jgi:hypothetical protein
MATTENDLSHAAWRKSTHSGSGICLETVPVPSSIVVRDSADPKGRPWSSLAALG